MKIVVFLLCFVLFLGCSDEEGTNPVVDITSLQTQINVLQQHIETLKITKPAVNLTDLQDQLNALQAEVDALKQGKEPIVNPKIATDLPPAIKDKVPDKPIDRVPTPLTEGAGIIVYRGLIDDIRIVNPDGTDDTPIAMGDFPELSPDRRFVIYTARQHIHMTSIHGGAVVQLSNEDDIDGHRDATWSRDGKFIAYYYFGGKIYVINSDGTNRRLITTGGGPNLSWSPDSEYLVFASKRFSDNLEIYTVNVDRSPHLRQITNDPGDEYEPDWSPDGRRIAFVRDSLTASTIHVMDTSSGIEAEVIEGFHPSWSPDGRRIAFSRPIAGTHMIFTVTANGSDLQQVTDTGGETPNWR